MTRKGKVVILVFKSKGWGRMLEIFSRNFLRLSCNVLKSFAFEFLIDRANIPLLNLPCVL